MSFEIVKKNYDRGLWTKQMVAMAVRKGVITPEQYSMITQVGFLLKPEPMAEERIAAMLEFQSMMMLPDE